MKPVTTYRMVAQQVPYTTYRLRMVKTCRAPKPSCATGGCATGNCATEIAHASDVSHEVTRIVVPNVRVRRPAEYELRKVPTKPDAKQPVADEKPAEKKPAAANPASAPRLTNPRDRITRVPIRRIIPASTHSTNDGWQAAGR
jgi:hypothetical protein